MFFPVLRALTRGNYVKLCVLKIDVGSSEFAPIQQEQRSPVLLLIPETFWRRIERSGTDRSRSKNNLI